MILLPTSKAASSEFTFRFYFFLYHYVPAFFIDIILFLKRSKIRLMPIYSKIYFHMNLMAYFGNNSWNFEDSKKLEIYSKMTKEDHLDFPCIPTEQELSDVYVNGVIGIAKYFFKETDDDMIEARKKLKFLKMLHYSFLAVVYGTILYLFYQIFNVYSLRILKLGEKL